jgi:hypothetical protein
LLAARAVVGIRNSKAGRGRFRNHMDRFVASNVTGQRRLCLPLHLARSRDEAEPSRNRILPCSNGVRPYSTRPWVSIHPNDRMRQRSRGRAPPNALVQIRRRHALTEHRNVGRPILGWPGGGTKSPNALTLLRLRRDEAILLVGARPPRLRAREHRNPCGRRASAIGRRSDADFRSRRASSRISKFAAARRPGSSSE